MDKIQRIKRRQEALFMEKECPSEMHQGAQVSRVEVYGIDLPGLMEGLQQVLESQLDRLQSPSPLREAATLPTGKVWYSAADLMERWSCGKSKIYELPNSELPSWKRGNHKLFFWAHVAAFEGRMSMTDADSHFKHPETEVSSWLSKEALSTD